MGVINVVADSYKPSDDEPFMNERQRDYFRRKLVAWRGRGVKILDWERLAQLAQFDPTYLSLTPEPR